MERKNMKEENSFKWSYEKTDETPYYLDLKYQGRIWCDYNLFRIIRREEEKEYKRRDMESRCVIISKNRVMKCRKKCSTDCPYGLNSHRSGFPISLSSIDENNDSEIIDETADIVKKIDIDECIKLINKIVLELNKRDLVIFNCIYINDYSEKYVAEKLNLSRSTICQRLKEIRERIKKELTNINKVVK